MLESAMHEKSVETFIVFSIRIINICMHKFFKYGVMDTYYLEMYI